jgi:hypothetical protein
MYKCFRLFSSSCVEKWIAEDNGAAKEMQIRPTLMNPMKAVFIKTCHSASVPMNFGFAQKWLKLNWDFFTTGRYYETAGKIL